jgi:hypothetical protein
VLQERLDQNGTEYHCKTNWQINYEDLNKPIVGLKETMSL